MDITVGNGNIIFQSGNAIKYLGEYFEKEEYFNPYDDDPKDVRSVSFNSNGDVLNGNIYKDKIIDIFDSYSVT